MDQLTQFARRLAERLGDGGGGVYRPVSVTDVRATILPYRAHRKALALDSVEDYETVLLRLAAEERGFVKTLPPAVAERCRKELTQPNPDLGVLDEIGDATLQMTSMAAASVPPPTPDPTPMRSAEDQAEPEANSCRKCRNPLPRGRQVVFCPWCGERLIPFTCERCGTQLDSEWKHCITCGTGVRDPYRFV